MVGDAGVDSVVVVVMMMMTMTMTTMMMMKKTVMIMMTTTIRRIKPVAAVLTTTPMAPRGGATSTNAHSDLGIPISFEFSNTDVHPSQTAPRLAHAYKQREHTTHTQAHIPNLHIKPMSSHTRTRTRTRTRQPHVPHQQAHHKALAGGGTLSALRTNRNDKQWSLKN